MGEPKAEMKKHQSPLVMAATDNKATITENQQQQNQSRKSRKRARKEAQEDKEEEELTRLIFGGDNAATINETAEQEESDLFPPQHDNDEVEFGFQIDRGGSGTKAFYGSNDDDEEEKGYPDDDDDDENDLAEDTPAWVDDEDEAEISLVEGSSRLRKLRNSRQETRALSAEELEQRLRKRYEESTQRTARTDWARPSKSKVDDDEEDEASKLFSTSGSLLASSKYRLPPSILKIVRCPDANQADYSKSVVRSVHFHPGSDPNTPLLLTAGLDKSLRFFQVGAEKSEKIHGIHCKEIDHSFVYINIYSTLSHIYLLSPGLQFPNYPFIQLIFWATQEMLL